MSKTLRMREFNKHLDERIARVKAFPGSKSQQRLLGRRSTYGRNQ